MRPCAACPPRQRPDIDKELRASIADAIDDHIEAGSDSDAAETRRPHRARRPGTAGRRLRRPPAAPHRPGAVPRLLRLLTSLLATVLPIVARGRRPRAGRRRRDRRHRHHDRARRGDHGRRAHRFWTTLLFVLIERRPAMRPTMRPTPAEPWTPAALPDPRPTRGARFGEVVGEAVVLVLTVTFLLISPLLRIRTDAAGDPIGLFSPWLWDTGVVYVLSLLAIARLGLSVAKHYTRWNLPLAVARPVVDLACVAVVLGLHSADRLLNPAFVEAVGWPAGAMRWVGIGLGVALVVELARAVVELVAGITTRSWPAADIGALLRRSVDALPGPRRR